MGCIPKEDEPMGRRTPPDVFEANLGGIENPDFEEDGEPWATAPPPPRPRIRATTPNPSRSIDQALERINDLYAWAAENDPPPAWWKWRARREWRHRWGIT
jgi:hypothetical protein